MYHKKAEEGATSLKCGVNDRRVPCRKALSRRGPEILRCWEGREEEVRCTKSRPMSAAL